MDYEFLKNLSESRRDNVINHLLTDRNFEGLLKAVKSGYQVETWVLEWLYLDSRTNIIDKLLNEDFPVFSLETIDFLKAYLGQDGYENWRKQRNTKFEKERQDKAETQKRVAMESLKARVEKEGFTRSFLSDLLETNLLVEIYGEEKVYEEASKHGLAWRFEYAISDDFWLSKKQYTMLKPSRQNAKKLIELGQYEQVYRWKDTPWVVSLLREYNPSFLLSKGCYAELDRNAKKMLTDADWLSYYDRYGSEAWNKLQKNNETAYLVDAMTHAKRRGWLLRHGYVGKFFKTFFS